MRDGSTQFIRDLWANREKEDPEIVKRPGRNKELGVFQMLGAAYLIAGVVASAASALVPRRYGAFNDDLSSVKTGVLISGGGTMALGGLCLLPTIPTRY